MANGNPSKSNGGIIGPINLASNAGSPGVTLATASGTVTAGGMRLFNATLVAGGGGGGSGFGGGAGAGGLKTYSCVPVTGNFPVSIGGGGAGGIVCQCSPGSCALSTAGNDTYVVSSCYSVCGGGRGGEGSSAGPLSPVGPKGGDGGSGGGAPGGAPGGISLFFFLPFLHDLTRPLYAFSYLQLPHT